MLSDERYAELEQNGLDGYYDRVASYVLQANLPNLMQLLVYPIYSKDEENGITESQQQERAGREDAVYSGLITALKTDNLPACSWQALLQVNQDENPVKVFTQPVPMLPLTEIPDGIIDIENPDVDARRQAELLSEHIELRDSTQGAAARMELWGDYCQLKYGRVLTWTDDIYTLISQSSRERKERKQQEDDKQLLKTFSGKYMGVSAADLLKKELPPISWTWQNVLQDVGIGVLAGSPKAGKSYFATELAVHVARGEKYLAWNTNKTDVLYIDIDDKNESRAQQRIDDTTDGRAPENLIYYVPERGDYMETMDDNPNTLDRLKAMLLYYKNVDKRHLDIRFIIIDVYTEILASKGKAGLDAYRQGRQEIRPLRTFAIENGVFILLIHHLKKGMDYDNPYNSISGSNALYSATDAGLVLIGDVKNPQKKLFIQGRDQEPGEHILTFDGTRKRFYYDGTADSVSQTYADNLYKDHPIRKALVELVNAAGMVTGSLSDIMEEYETRTQTNLPYLPKQVSDFISKYEDKLRDRDGIKYTYMRHGRRYTFEKIKPLNINELELDENP